MKPRFVVTGGPGGGKTTLLSALAEHGYHVVSESARSIIKERLAAGLSSRPDPVSFGRRVLYSDIKKYRETVVVDRATFFDRGVLDALYMLDVEGALPESEIANYVQAFPYSDIVFLLPPWKEIYTTDAERDQRFEESIAVFEGMRKWYSQWGYETIEVPRSSIGERVSFVLQSIGTL